MENTVLFFKCVFALGFLMFFWKRVESLKEPLNRIESEKFVFSKWLKKDAFEIVTSLIAAIGVLVVGDTQGITKDIAAEIDLSGLFPAFISGFGLPSAVNGALQIFGLSNKTRKMVEQKLKDETPKQ